MDHTLATRSRDTGCALEEVRHEQFIRGVTTHHSRFTARRVDSHYLECRAGLAQLVWQIASELKAGEVDLFEALVAIRRTADTGLAFEGIGESAKAEVLAEITVWVVGAYNALDGSAPPTLGVTLSSAYVASRSYGSGKSPS